MKIIVVDDDNIYAHVGFVNLLNRMGRGTDEVVQLTRPEDLQTSLTRNPDTQLVLVDMHYQGQDRNDQDHGLTGLSAFMLLAAESSPPAVGFSAPEDNRLLYPYAACQMLPRAPIGWILKNAFDETELISIVQQIGKGKAPQASKALRQFLPSNSLTGDLMRQLLTDKIDLEIWRLLSGRPYKDVEVARKIFMGPSAVRNRYRKYRDAIIQLMTALGRLDAAEQQRDQPPGPGPHRWLLNWDPAGPEANKLSPVIGQFARENRDFFHAPELDTLVSD